jgi:hypothetical protein
MVTSPFVAALYLDAYGWGKLNLWLPIVGSVALFYFLLKRLAVYKAEVTAEAESVTVQRSDRTAPIIIPYAEVVTYGDTSIRSRSVLRFKMADGTRHKLVAEELLGSAGNFWGMVHTLDQAAEQYRRRSTDDQRTADNSTLGAVPAPPLIPSSYEPMARERGFFKTRSSTVVLILYSIVLVLALLITKLSMQSASPLLGVGIALWVCYLMPWLINMDERIRYAEHDRERAGRAES